MSLPVRHPGRKVGGVWRGPHFIGLFLLVVALLIAPLPAYAIDASIVIDANTDTVISQQNPDRLLHPASLTKMMTLYMTFEALEQGRVTLQSTLPVSALAEAQSATKLNLVKGQRIRVEDAILGLCTLSANDAAVVMAEGLGGSEDRFAALMTRKAHQLGMVNTNFRNANGLPDPGQISTARDIAILARALIRQYPQYYHYFSVREFTYAGISYANHNHLMSRYEGMDGLKTGFIRASGFNLAASAVRNGRRLIAVVFGGTSAVQRDDYLASLLDEGFQHTGGVAMASAAPPPIPGHKPTDGPPVQNIAEAPTVSLPPAPTPLMPAPIVAAGKPPSDIGRLIAADGIAAGIGEGDRESPDDVDPKAASVKVASAAGRAAGPKAEQQGGWSIQVGAYATRAATEQAIQQAIRRAPDLLKNATAVVLALPHRRHALYRARLTGLGADDARKACRLLAHCMTLPPGAS